MSVREPLIIFKHVGTDSDAEQRVQQAKLGCAPAHKLFALLDVSKRDGVQSPRAFSDYSLTFNRSQLPKGVQAGFAVSGEGGGVHIEWDTPPSNVEVK